MKSIQIELKEAQSVKKFVNTVMKCPYDVDLRSGRHIVDAKSILGIFSLDLSKPIDLEIYSDDCEDFLAAISSFVV